MINLHERMLPTWRGSNPQPPDHQWDAHSTEPLMPALSIMYMSPPVYDKHIPDQTDHHRIIRHGVLVISQCIKPRLYYLPIGFSLNADNGQWWIHIQICTLYVFEGLNHQAFVLKQAMIKAQMRLTSHSLCHVNDSVTITLPEGLITLVCSKYIISGYLTGQSDDCFLFKIQSTLIISTSLISNSHLNRSEILVLFLHRNLRTGNKILWKRGEIASPLFHIILYIFLTSGVKLHIHLLNVIVWFIVFLTLSTLICRGTDISKCFSESFGIRDNESRLYIVSCYKPEFQIRHFSQCFDTDIFLICPQKHMLQVLIRS